MIVSKSPCQTVENQYIIDGVGQCLCTSNTTRDATWYKEPQLRNLQKNKEKRANAQRKAYHLYPAPEEYWKTNKA